MKNRSFHRLPVACIAVLLLSASAAWAGVTVEKKNQQWHVHADAEPISQVLAALGQQTGIKISGTQKLLTDPEISGEFTGSLAVVLSRILRGIDYATETAPNKTGELEITRLIVLSGEVGQAPIARVAPIPRRLQRPLSQAEVAQAEEDGARVSTLLQTTAQVAGGLPITSANNSGGGISRNEDGSFAIEPEAQARMAEATRRAQADLQALINSLRQNENRSNSE